MLVQLPLQKVLPKTYGPATTRSASPAWFHSSSRPATPASAPTPSRLGPGSALAVTTGLDLQDGAAGLGPVTADGGFLQQHRGVVSAPAEQHAWERGGGYVQEVPPAAGLGIEPSVLVPWFAVTAELLGDVIRLAWHWHEVDRRGREAGPAHAAEGAAVSAEGLPAGGVAVAPARQQRALQPGGFPREDAELLGSADWALCRLAQAMDRQVETGRQQAPAAAAAGAAATTQGGVHGSHSSSSLQDLAAGARAAGQVDMTASMEALAVRLLRPPPYVDELFALMRERKEHLLTGGGLVDRLAAGRTHVTENAPGVCSSCAVIQQHLLVASKQYKCFVPKI